MGVGTAQEAFENYFPNELMQWLLDKLRSSLAPYGSLRRIFELGMFKLTESGRLKAFKDRYRGERCFLIGNGPSLIQHDIRKLLHEKTFVTNMFVLHGFAKELSPSFYCISDWIHWSKPGGFTPTLRQGFRDLGDSAFFFEYDAKRVVNRTQELKNRFVYYLFQQEPSHSVWQGEFNTDVTYPVIWGRTVMVDFCIPLACYMGFKDLYLIGNDYNWNIDNSSVLERAYFYDIKDDDRKLPESQAHQDTGRPEHIALVMKAFEVVKREVEASGHRIWNAGYGGRLEVFPRVEYNDLFE
jgi:hypothetical protein